MNAYFREKGFYKWFETSAKENINIETSIRSLIDEIMKHTDRIKPVERTLIRLEDPVINKDDNKKSGGGCCSEK